jgi:alkylation response protein AidB-like acyl-CoA dehydrogenase
VHDRDGVPVLCNGTPDIRILLLPASVCEIIDTWQTAGLRGTGSHDFRVEDVFVPAEPAVPMSAFFVGPERSDAVHRTPFYDLASPSISAVGLGIARDAIESFKSLASRKIPATGSLPVASLHTVQQSVAHAEALLRSAQAYLYETVCSITAAHQAGVPVSDEHRASLRLAATHCARSAVDAVDLMFEAGGGTAIYESSRLARCFRDVHLVTHHMMTAPLNLAMVGQYLLGGPLQLRH